MTFFLLETFNNLIQYQFEGNHHLVYIIIRRRKIFRALQNLQLVVTSSAESSPEGTIIVASLPKESFTEHFSVHLPLSTATSFVPTTEWLMSWKKMLPFDVIVRSLQVLVPQVEDLCKQNKATAEEEILEFLKQGTLVGLLPSPHPIIVRKAGKVMAASSLWLQFYVWHLIFCRNLNPADTAIWQGTNIKLFTVQASVPIS